MVSQAHTRRDVLILIALVLLLRLPFLNQAIGGDEPYFLAAAKHALIEPLHPNHIWYVFEGKDANFQGFTHPPLNAGYLALLLKIFSGARETAMHACYLPFSLAAVLAMYALARRFSTNALSAALLFAVVPAFVINGNTLEADVPLLAFWTVGIAAFVYERDSLAFFSLAASALIAMQAIAFTPILLLYLYLFRESASWKRLTIAFAPILSLGCWQLFERVTSGQFPFQVASGYLLISRYQRLLVKAEDALVLAIHASFLVLPFLLPYTLKQLKSREDRFLAGWAILFFTAACVLFYSGSARYVLPMAAPVCLLAARAPAMLLRVGIAIQLAIGLGLATVNYQHWNAYRSFAESMRGQVAAHQTWVDAEWGLRHYFEQQGAQPLRRDQYVADGEIVIVSDLAFPAPYPLGGRAKTVLSQIEINPSLPLRVIGLEARSGYETFALGFLPFDVRGGVIDRVRAVTLTPHQPELSYLPMNAPGAETQFLFGISTLENGQWRWMGEKASLLLKNPGAPAVLEARIFKPDASPAHTFTLSVQGGPSVTTLIDAPGAYVIRLPVGRLVDGPVTVTLQPDRTFSPPADQRKLGVVVNAVGFVTR